MANGIWFFIISVIALGLGGVIGFYIRHYLTQQQNQRMKSEGERILGEAREKASNIELEARDQALEIRQKAEKETNRRRSEITKEEDVQAGTIVLELIPRASQNNLSKIIMRLNSKNFRIYQTEVYDLFENLTRITFSQIQIDTNLNDSLFTFTPPPGVEILSPPTVPLPQR